MNNCSFIGRIAQDVELKSTQNGVSVCSFSLAVDRPGSKERKTDFIPVVAWEKTAEFISRYFGKGQKIGLTGTLTTRAYLDKNEQKRIAFEVVADRAFFCEKSENGGATTPTAAPSAQNAFSAAVSIGNVETFEEIEDEEDLPF